MTTPNTLNRRSVMLSAAALTGLPLLGQVSAHAEGPGIDLGEWTLIDSLSDSFDAPLDAARWRRGLWYSVSGAGAFREENAETSGGVLYLNDIAQYSKTIQQGIVFLLDKAERLGVRVICPSTRRPEEMLDNPNYDTRLAALLSGLTIAIPPLRSQPEDIAFLVNKSKAIGQSFASSAPLLERI